MRKQNLDPETGLKNEPIHYFSNKNYTKMGGPKMGAEFNTGDHHFVFEDDPPRLPVKVKSCQKIYKNLGVE